MVNFASIYETNTDNLESEFEEMIRDPNMPRLGPADLMIVHKINNKAKNKKIETFYHHVSGLCVKSSDIVLDYYNKIEKYQQEQNKKNQQSQYRLMGCTYRGWNSFTQTEVVVEIDQNRNIKEYSKKGNNPSKLNPEVYYQLRLSGFLRYFRGSFPIFCGMFSGSPLEIKYLNIYSPGQLKIEPFKYIAHEHPISNDLLDALSYGMAYSLNPKQIISFLIDFQDQFQRVFINMTRIYAQEEEIVTAFYFMIEEHVQHFPDDIESVVVLVNHYLNIGKASKCKQFVPLLENTVFDNPASEICLARICLYQRRIEDAFVYLNMASYAHCWIPHVKEFATLSKPELRIIRSPLTGLFSFYIDAALEMFRIAGQKFVVKMVRAFYDLAETNDDFVQTFAKNHFYKEKLMVKSEEEKFLFDPGIESIPKARSLIPLTETWMDALKIATNYDGRYEKLKTKKIPFNNDGLLNLVVELKFKDPELLKKTFSVLCSSKTVTGVDYLIMLKAVSEGILPLSDVPMKEYPINSNQSQNNAIYFTRDMLTHINDGIKRMNEAINERRNTW